MNNKLISQFRLTEELYKILNQLKFSIDANWVAYMEDDYRYLIFKEDGTYYFSNYYSVYDWSFPIQLYSFEDTVSLVQEVFDYNNDLLHTLYNEEAHLYGLVEGDQKRKLKWTSKRKISVMDGSLDVTSFILESIGQE